MTRQNNKSKGKSGRKQNEVWEYFEKKPLKSPGHFSGECKFCYQKWNRAYVGVLQSHLANECDKCPEGIQSFWLGFVAAKDSLDDDAAFDTLQDSTNSNNKKRKVLDGQTEIEDYYENRELSEKKEASINRALIRAFVCCGISFSVIDSPFYRELLYQLRPNYNPPSRKVLSENLLNQEISRVNKAVNRELELSENLTLALDGWTSPSTISIYNFIILTPSNQQYLYCLRDFSSSHHTGEFLASEIKTIIDKIGADKFSAIVTDNASNVRLARELVTQEYPKILNLRCIAHFINLITKSILDHSTATKIIAACNNVTKFFKTSHIAHSLLSDYAKTLEIEGGGLKCFIKTRWTSMYEATYSIVRMKRALEEVMIKHSEEITNSTVKKILKKPSFYDQVNALANLLRPIKNAILMLEGDQANLADAFIQMVRLAFMIKNLNVNNLVTFRQHAIQAFNKRWEKFDISLYLLAYFLHPKFRTNGLRSGKYSLITSAAGKIWKSMGNDQGSCENLYHQMRRYRLYLEPYNEELGEDETPMLWWLSIDDTKKHLQELALYVLSITPHSASCERIFSTLGWIYGKRRLRLQTSKVESMAKIRSFYVSKVNDELRYASSKYSKSELKTMIDESLDDSLEDDFEEGEPEKELVEQHEIPNNIVSVLILENLFDISSVPFFKDSEDDDLENESSESENENDVNLIEKDRNYDYDVDELAAKYLD